jgi:hypothetical protein
MTDETSSEATADEGAEGQDSPVIQQLRAQLKAAEKEAKDAKGQAKEAADAARTQVLRELRAEQLVKAAGFPKLAELAVERIEGEITDESVASFLEGLGLQAGEQEPSGDGDGGGGDASTSVEQVARLGARVADASRDQLGKGVIDRLNQTQSIEEITAIANEAGFAH